MASNPFLMEDLADYGGQSNGVSSNPFLSGTDYSIPDASDNPFLNNVDPSPFSSSTNPFADFESSYEPTSDNIFATENNLDYTNIFSNTTETSNEQDFFGAAEPEPVEPPAPIQPAPVEPAPAPVHAAPARPPPIKPEVPPTLNLMEDVSNDFCPETAQIFDAPPKRPPPPPRPTLPPSKETKDLILSVTGAMDATSSHLLDRLQATRTPSPTPIRDLHTPSPTHDAHFGDLLEADEHSTHLGMMGTDVSPTPAPPPPAPARPARPPTPQGDMFDMFGTSRPPPPASNADILGLFNISKQAVEVKADLLSDDFVPHPEPLPTTDSIPNFAPPPAEDLTSLDDFVTDAYPEVNDNIVKSESSTSVPLQEILPPPEEASPEPVREPRNSIPEIIKASIPESFVSNIPDTFKSELSDSFGTGIPDSYASINEEYGSSLHDTFGTTIDDGFSSGQPDTYSAATETFSSTIADSFGTTINDSYTTINENFGTTVDDGFDSSQMDTFSAVSDTFSAVPDNTYSGIQDTFSSTIPETYSVNDNYSTIGDTFGSGMGDDTIESYATQDTFGSTFGTTIHETYGSALDETFGHPPPPGGQDFDDFEAKFDNIASKDEIQGVAVAEDPFDPFGSAAAPDTSGGDAWGASAVGGEVMGGFGGDDDGFDAFLSMNEPPAPVVPPAPPTRFRRHESADSDEGQKNFSVLIKPRNAEAEPPTSLGFAALAPPPKSPQNAAFTDNSSRFNPFNVEKSLDLTQALPPQGEPIGALERTDSQETPPTPLFDEDVSQPLEDFPRVLYAGEGWEMHLRQPNKKKITGQRFWKKVFVKLVHQGDSPVLQLYNTKEDKDPFQELPLQACYSVSDIGAQQFDNFGKIFTVKLQYVFYKERPGVRPGQVTKAERITTKLSQFAAYAIQGDYQGCKEFGSDLKKLGLPVEHAPQISQLFKLGCQSFEDLKTFSVQVEECLFRLNVHRDRALNYKTEEVQITAVDELYVEQDCYGHVDKQIARVRLFFLGFLAGMPDVELGVNDMWRQGKEVVGRHDIIPVVTEEWIRLENVEFHACVQLDEYERTHVIKFKPPDSCYLELMRFRIRPPKNRELPLQVKTVMCVTGNKVQLNCDILVPGFSSRKLGQIPCEDIMIRFPIPECWIYLFRVEKHFRYGSVKSTHRRTGKVKGIERFLGAMETLDQSLIEVTSGQAKYEHQHRAIVWRMSRLPKEGQGAYTTHNLVCRMGLTSFDQIPDQLAEYCYVEFTMPATQASHMTVRSVSLSNQAKDDPPEKYVRQLARHEYRVGIEHTQGEGPGAYVSATIAKPAAPAPPPVVDQLDQPEPIAESDSDSSN